LLDKRISESGIEVNASLPLLQKIVILPANPSVFHLGVAVIAGAFQIVSLEDGDAWLEDILHNHESILSPFPSDKRVQPHKPGEVAAVLGHVLVVAGQDPEEALELTLADGLEHVPAVCGIVEEGPALALGGEFGEAAELPGEEAGHEALRAHGLEVLLVLDAPALPQQPEGVRCEVSDPASGRSGVRTQLVREALARVRPRVPRPVRVVHCDRYPQHHLRRHRPARVPQVHLLPRPVTVDVLHRVRPQQLFHRLHFLHSLQRNL
jgi:hypothetical protein